MRNTEELCTFRRRMPKGRYFFLVEEVDERCLSKKINKNAPLWKGQFVNGYGEKEGKLLTKEGIKKIYFYGAFLWTFDKEERDIYSKEHHNKPSK